MFYARFCPSENIWSATALLVAKWKSMSGMTPIENRINAAFLDTFSILIIKKHGVRMIYSVDLLLAYSL